MAALALLGLNLADALLSRMNLKLGEVGLSPLVPPFEANLMARGLAAIAIILTLYLIRKRDWLWWLNGLMVCLISWHWLGPWLSSLAGTP